MLSFVFVRPLLPFEQNNPALPPLFQLPPRYTQRLPYLGTLPTSLTRRI